VGRELDRITEVRGYPMMVVRGNGTEVTSNTAFNWQEKRGAAWHPIR
jgi:putative transposase